MAKSRMSQVVVDLRRRGLRKRYAKAVARAAREQAAGREAPAALRAYAEELRALAADVERLGVGEHGEPQASARRAAHPPLTGEEAAPAAPAANVRRRVRRN